MIASLHSKRILIFVVAYNAEKTIDSVLDRIPESLHTPNVEVLIIDDSSKDATFEAGVKRERSSQGFRITTLRTPVNQGYGGNQKLGYRYAINHGFDVVALLHGDGQYAPEMLPELLAPFFSEEVDAVFGSRMIQKLDALKGGMPKYKWLGNQVLTRFQNAMLGSHLSEFHSGYRLYSTAALRRIPFERNSNDFHFDTDIIIQLQFAGLTIKELAIPTFYGDEICHVNGMKYAWDIFRTMLRAKFHDKNLLYDRKFDVGQVELTYDLKLGFASSHTFALNAVKAGARVLDIGCGQGLVADEMAKKAGCVVGVDQYVRTATLPNVLFEQWNLEAGEIPVDVSQFDQIFLLDVIEHLKEPEVFMEKLRAAAARKRPEIVISTANIAFFVTRLMLLLGHFNYGRKGILDRTHTRLFTFNSLRELLQQTGYEIAETRGIPAPFPKALGDNALGRGLVRLNELLLGIFRGLFSYQIFIRARALPTVPTLLGETVAASAALKSGPQRNADRADPVLEEVQ
ncbi:MAG: bifunctional glycosyltransferase/class I SAM-dependent methyltransferase [Verrucomicrobiota bacterium]